MLTSEGVLTYAGSDPSKQVRAASQDESTVMGRHEADCVASL
jgi:hypothetical protein